MGKLKKVMLWIISIFFIGSALTYFSQIAIASILLLIVSVALLPPVNEKIKEKIKNDEKIKHYRSMRNIVAVIITMIFLASVPSNENINNTNTLINNSAIVSSMQSDNTIEQQIKATDQATTEENNTTIKENEIKEQEQEDQEISPQDDQTQTEEVTETNGIYTGKRVNGKKHGKGKYVWNDGAEYEGEFKNDKIDGKGKLTIPNKGTYNGYFSNGKKNGQGTYKFANGDTYTGNWKNDKMSGQGKYTFKNGDTYVGKFSNNKFNGKGTYTKSGKKYTGTWKNNKYQK